MKPDLEKAKSEIEVVDNDVADLARAARMQGRLVLALVGILTAAVSFLVAIAWPSQKEDVSNGYPYVSFLAAPVVTLTDRRRFIIAIPTLVVIAMISFGFGALFNDAFFGFGAAYSAFDRDHLKRRNRH